MYDIQVLQFIGQNYPSATITGMTTQEDGTEAIVHVDLLVPLRVHFAIVNGKIIGGAEEIPSVSQ